MYIFIIHVGDNVNVGHTIWMTGLPCSGKTTIAEMTAKKIREQYKIPVIVLDGDVVRKHITYDLGYTKEERDKNIRTIADICNVINMNDVLCIASIISPTKEIRDYAREKISKFHEVYVKCPQKICEKRDVKGHYKDYRFGKIQNFVGMNIPYDEPESPGIILNTNRESPQESCDRLIRFIFKGLKE